ncbi:MAG TPA: serine hydrolase domain-containing protein [Caulobacteraceae bacterium]|jgi:CubicO group peptidase (beta-lactamase class C family)
MIRAAFSALALVALSSAAVAAEPPAMPPPTVEQVRAAVHDDRGKSGAPAVAALVYKNGRTFTWAEGVRAAGSAVAVTAGDKWLIGSCGKAMTALMIARLVEAGKLTFETRLLDVFPELRTGAKPGWSEVTVRQLLSHTAGIEEPDTLDKFAGPRAEPFSLAERRALLIKQAVAQPLAHPPGTSWSYSNSGVVFAAAMAERVTGLTYEQLLRREVFEPLGMTSAGFGAPADGGALDQPLGHGVAADGKTRVPIDARLEHQFDPPAVTPAGDIHVSLPDWLKFAQVVMAATQGRDRPGYIKASTVLDLLTMPANSQNYAGGWLVRMKDGKVQVLNHNGSDDYWIADIRIYPQHDAVVLVATNDAIALGDEPTLELSSRLADLVRPAPPPKPTG